MKLNILRVDTLSSTNTEAAKQAAAGAAEGLVIVAAEQTSGRGRHGRVWVSPRGAGLYTSIVLRPRFNATLWPLISLMAAVAVADAIKSACGILVDIKWPNDICVGAKKLCGILAETVDTPAGPAIVLGIGINLTVNALSAEVRPIAVSIEEITANTPDSEAVLNALLIEITRRYEELNRDHGVSTLREWSNRSSFAEGKRVRIALENETFEGVTRGLESDGALRVENGTGQIRIVRAGDVSAVREAEAVHRLISPQSHRDTEKYNR